jgi:molybdopterin converting factor small subunit
MKGASVGEAAGVVVEFFGMPRQRAGRAEMLVRAGTVSQALGAVEIACPGLTGLVQADGKVSPHFLLCINGNRFVADLNEPLGPADRLLVLSADAGG